MVQKNSHKDSLTIFRNNMMLEIAITEVNLRMAERDKLLAVDINPNLSAHIAGLTEKIKLIQKNIAMVDKLLEEEEKKLN